MSAAYRQALEVVCAENLNWFEVVKHVAKIAPQTLVDAAKLAGFKVPEEPEEVKSPFIVSIQELAEQYKQKWERERSIPRKVLWANFDPTRSEWMFSVEAMALIDDHILHRRHVEAIKLVRELTSMGLKESKDWADQRRDKIVGERGYA